MDISNEAKIRLQFEKAKSEINLQDNKAYFYKNLADLIGLITVLLTIAIIIAGITLITGMAGCATVISNF